MLNLIQLLFITTFNDGTQPAIAVLSGARNSNLSWIVGNYLLSGKKVRAYVVYAYFSSQSDDDSPRQLNKTPIEKHNPWLSSSAALQPVCSLSENMYILV